MEAIVGAQDLAGLLPRVVELRHDLHRHPERGFAEHRTQRVVRAWLLQHGWAPRTCAETGLVADLRTGGGPTIGLRADLDALPIHEATDLPYRSCTPGVAHKCGHDGHTAILCGVAAALVLAGDRVGGNVRLLFQPDEEGARGGGAAVMLREGALDGVDEVYGLHNWPGFPKGTLRVAAGPVMAEVHTLTLRLRGRGGHASEPQACRDPLAAGVQVVSALQALVARGIGYAERAVLSICRFAAGSVHNVIPDDAEILGTLRTFDGAVRDRLVARIPEVVDGVARAMGVEAELALEPGYPVLVNDPTCVGRVERAARAVLGVDAVSASGLPLAASEDFAFFAAARPSAYFFVGADTGDTPGCHHPDFDFDDDLIEPAIRVLLGIVGDRFR